MMTFVVRRVVPLVGLAVVLGALVRNQRVPDPSADAWFHLRFGAEFRHSWSLRDPGHLSVYDSADWVPTQWLPQVAMAWIEEQVGIAGIVFATGVLVLGLAVSLYLTCRQLAAPLPSAIACAAGMMAASPGLSARPQLFSYAFVILTVGAWLATARDGRPRYWLVAVAWLWPMLHGMWPVGISISLAAAVGMALQQGDRSRTALRWAVIPVASIVAAFLNPLGPSVVRGLFDVGARSSYFAEWGPTDFTQPAAAVLAVITALVLLTGLRSEPLPWVHVLLGLLGLAWALYSMRTTPVAAFILAPMLASAIQRVVPLADPPSRPELVSVASMLVVACTGLALVSAHRASDEVVPAWVDRRLEALPPATKVLNDWPSGSYVLARHPDLQLVMHGYGDVFTDQELERNADLVRMQPGWDRLVEDLDADIALLDPDTALGYSVEHLLGWTRVQGDDDFVLLTPPQ